MFAKKYVLIGGILIAILLFGVIFAVSAQTTIRSQQWEYAIFTWDVSDNEFSWRVSSVYDSLDFEFAIGHDVTQALWDILAKTEGASLVDYLAAMGVSGYELVDVANVQTSLFIYTFKRPAKQ